MKPSLGALFSLALVLVFAWALFEALGFRAQAGLFPVVIGVVGLALGLFHLGLELRRRRAPGGGPGQSEAAALLAAHEEADHAEKIAPEVRRQRTAAILAWIATFAVGIWLLGFSLAVPIAIFAYLKVGAGESWATSFIFAAASGASFYGVFAYALRIPFQEGVLVSLVDRALQ